MLKNPPPIFNTEMGTMNSCEPNFGFGQKQKANKPQSFNNMHKKIKGLMSNPQKMRTPNHQPKNFDNHIKQMAQKRAGFISNFTKNGKAYLKQQDALESQRPKPKFFADSFQKMLAAFKQRPETRSGLNFHEQSLIEAYLQFGGFEDGLVTFRKYGYTTFYKSTSVALRDIIFDQFQQLVRHLLNELPVSLRVQVFVEVLLGIILKDCGIEIKDSAQFTMVHMFSATQLSKSFLKQLFAEFRHLLEQYDAECLQLFLSIGIKWILNTLNFNSHSKLRMFGVVE